MSKFWWRLHQYELFAIALQVLFKALCSIEYLRFDFQNTNTLITFNNYIFCSVAYFLFNTQSMLSAPSINFACYNTALSLKLAASLTVRNCLFYVTFCFIACSVQLIYIMLNYQQMDRFIDNLLK